jgi:NADH-quinone oxidoreductase subunit L
MAFLAMRGAGEMHAPFIQHYFSWIPVGDLPIDAAFQLDQLSMVHDARHHGRRNADPHLQRRATCAKTPGYPRYFAYLNLFVFFMLLLVLGASYPLMFIGGKGVGLCSYLLIGFWFSEKAERRRRQEGVHRQPHRRLRLPDRDVPDVRNSGRSTSSGERGRAALQLGGVASPRSASSCSSAAPARARRSRCTSGCPTRWRSDAGLRAHPRGDDGDRRRVSRRAQHCCSRSRRSRPDRGVVGALTAIFAASIGLKQWDIKKVLAYSTVSQLGYMFVGVGRARTSAACSTS